MSRFAVEIGLILTALLLAGWARPTGARIQRALARLAGRAMCHPKRVTVALGLVGFLSAAAISCSVWWPQPEIHDEFSYRLAGETFASGRLTNPSPAFAEHFESFHVFVQPTRMSKYPPAQGTALALGRIALGQDLAGVWLSAALMLAAFLWMLRGFVAPGPALLGASFAACSYGVSSYWAQSYWGGAVTAIAGALIAGALARASSIRGSSPAHSFGLGPSVALGLGLILAVFSRPFENLLIFGPMTLTAFVLMNPEARRRVLVTLTLSTLIAGGLQAGYNRALTGSYTQLPYEVHEAEYNETPVFLWQPAGAAIEYRHEVMERYWRGWGRGDHGRVDSATALISIFVERVMRARAFYLDRTLLFLILLGVLLGASARRRKLHTSESALALQRRRSTATLALLMSAGLGATVAAGSTTYFLSHYLAGGAGLLALVVLQAWRRVAAWGGVSFKGPRQVGGGHAERPSFGQAWAGWTLLALVLALVPKILERSELRHGFAEHRAQTLASLQAMPGDDLVFVSYREGHGDEEWVYNAADLEKSPVIWARDLGPRENRRLLQRFSTRRVWQIEIREPDRLPRLVEWKSAKPKQADETPR